MSSRVLRVARPFALALILGSAATAAWGIQLDAPTMTLVGTGDNKTVIRVTAGPSGAPSGFTLWWMKRSDFDVSGWSPAGTNPAQFEAYFLGEPTLNVFEGDAASFLLGSNEAITVECGDLFDETGVTHYSDALEEGMEYMYVVFANAAPGWEESAASLNLSATTTQGACTNGFWKTHGPAPCVTGGNSNDWPTNGNGLTLGNIAYTDAQLCSIFQQGAAGNGLISLAHQLIAAKFNLLIGANASCIAATIAAADALIGNLVIPPVGGGFLAPGTTAALTQTLDDYNNGLLCVQHGPCPPVPPTPTDGTTWGAVKGLYR
jgi:hypothetical protein